MPKFQVSDIVKLTKFIHPIDQYHVTIGKHYTIVNTNYEHGVDIKDDDDKTYYVFNEQLAKLPNIDKLNEARKILNDFYKKDLEIE